MNKTEKAILKTLAFFDLFNRPLTLEELWLNLYKLETSKMQVLFGLKNLQKNNIIVEKNTFYALTGNKNIFRDFVKTRVICKKRWRKVERTLKFLRFVPFVKNISVINSLAFKASNENSDIDILIVTKKNRLWTARAFMVLFLEILGQNKNKWYKAGKFCLGFAFTEERLALESLLYKNDIGFIYWLATLYPVIDRKIYKNLIEENAWIYDYLPNWQMTECENLKNKNDILEKILSGKFGERLEKYLANTQIKRIWQDEENYRTGASVITDSSMMKLHAYDKREEYRNRWQKKIEELKV